MLGFLTWEVDNGGGIRYYYNKVSKQSRWSMPEEMKVGYNEHFLVSILVFARDKVFSEHSWPITGGSGAG